MSLITVVYWTMTKYDEYGCHGTSHKEYYDWQQKYDEYGCHGTSHKEYYDWQQSKARFFESYHSENFN